MNSLAVILFVAIAGCSTMSSPQSKAASESVVAPRVATTTPTVRMATHGEFQAALDDAAQGAEVLTSIPSLADVPILPVTIQADAVQPQLVLSDKPEYFRTGDGIATQERVEPGVVRLYVYHVPVPNVQENAGGKRIVAAIDNLGDKPLRLVMRRSALAPVGAFYQKMARGVMETIVSKTAPAPSEPTVIAKRAEIDPQLSVAVRQQDLLVHGWYEFTIDQPARITVAQIGAQDDPNKIDVLPRLPRKTPGHDASGAGRGLFKESEFTVTQPSDAPVYDTSRGSAQIVIADGVNDPWMSGTDAIEPAEPILNKGNYGAIYRIKLKVMSSDRKSLAVLIASNRQDNKWCQSTSLAAHLSAGIFPAGVVLAPRDRPVFASIPNAVVLQKFDLPESGVPIEIEITYTPPGASCLPTPILLVPMDR